MTRLNKEFKGQLLAAATLASAAVWAVQLYVVFQVAPVEEQMGIVQKIFYIHVPSAYAMYLGFALCAVCSGIYLFRPSSRWDSVAVAAGEVGLLFCFVVLITGPLWARKAWGVYWTWDPRLTTTLLAGLVFAAYVTLRSTGSDTQAEKKMAAALAVLGLLDLPIIHYSVQRWRGQHPTVITAQGGGLTQEMLAALLWGVVFFTLLSVVLIAIRAKLESHRQKLEYLEHQLAEET